MRERLVWSALQYPASLAYSPIKSLQLTDGGGIPCLIEAFAAQSTHSAPRVSLKVGKAAIYEKLPTLLKLRTMPGRQTSDALLLRGKGQDGH